MPSSDRDRHGAAQRRDGARAEQLTPTGIRIIGSEAIALIASRAEDASVVSAGREEDTLYISRFVVRPRMGTGSPLAAVLTSLDALLRKQWPEAPPLTVHTPLSRPAARFTGIWWDVLPGDESWTGELRVRHPHPVISGAPCTTHVIIAEHSGHVNLTVRVTADNGPGSVQGNVGAGQARPAFLDELSQKARLLFEMSDGMPRTLSAQLVQDFVATVLLSEKRSHPVVVIAPLEEGGYLIPPATIANEFLGLALLYTFERHQDTFALSDALGDRRLSCYWGAMRIYMPTFSCADRPDDHPLLFRDRLLDPVMRGELVGRLGRGARLRVRMPPGVTELRSAAEGGESGVRASSAMGSERAREDSTDHSSGAAPASAPANGAIADRTSQGGAAGSVVAEGAGEVMITRELVRDDAAGSGTADGRVAVAAPLSGEYMVAMSSLGGAIGTFARDVETLTQRLGELGGAMERLVEANAVLCDEIQRLRTSAAVRAMGTNTLEKRINTLVSTMSRLLEVNSSAAQVGGEAVSEVESPEDEDDSENLTLVDVLKQASASHSDALLVLEGAERSARESPYEDVERVAVILDAMAQVARRRQRGAMGVSLRDAFREVGIDYRGGIARSTSARHREQYSVAGAGGEVYDCAEHIAMGDSYDPRHCLRIYFTSRHRLDPRFVIGHVGRHFDVKTTT